MADDKKSDSLEAPDVASAKEPQLIDFTDLAHEDLTDEDMADIRRLLEQKQDVTRQDITAQDFQSLLSRYTKE